MKVLMIGSHLRVTGGITRVIKNYFEAGLGKKVSLEHFPTYFGSNHIYNLIYYFIKYLTLIIKLFVFNQKYDVAHIHMSYKGSFFRKKLIINLLYTKNIPIIIHMHGSQFKDFYKDSSPSQKRKIQCTLNKASAILALGEQWKSFYQEISTSHVISLDNAVFPKDILKENHDKKYITTMGVISKRKGSYDLVRLASNIKGKIDEGYKFLLAGDGEISELKSKIKELDVEDMFVLPGWISNQEKIEEIYQKSALYILPSYNEGMPMSILEAMSYGLPVISTNVGSIPSVVEKDNGIIFTPGDIQTLEKSIISLLNDKDKIDFYAKNNVEKIKKKYNIYDSINQLVSIYKNIQSVNRNDQ